MQTYFSPASDFSRQPMRRQIGRGLSRVACNLFCAMKRHGRSCAVVALALPALLATGPGPDGLALAARLEGQYFDNTITLAGKPLKLNGLGLRGVAWIKAFVAGIYVSVPSKDPAQLLAVPGPKRIRMKVMLEASSHELTKSFQHGARNESEAAQKVLRERVLALSDRIDSLGTLKPGDVLDMDYLPDKGVQLRRNEQDIGEAVQGEDLYRVVMKVFVGERPVDKRMKEGLLRGGY